MANLGVLRSLCLMMWLAIFFVSANGNRINFQRTKANCLDGSAGKPDGSVSGGPAFMMPGRKNDAGETDVPALIPLQPALNSINAVSIARYTKFTFNLTCPV